MSRSVPYRREVSEICNWHQDQALNSTIYILYNTGPTGFLLKEEGESKNFKAFLGDQHNCTCPIFKKEKDLCKHICWLLLKKFRVPRTNPLSWQLGLVEREINEILRGLTVKENSTRAIVKKQNTEQVTNSTEQGGIKQRVISEEDMCPICQDDFLSKKLPVTFCKFGCGNNVHIKCMKVWADHQKSNGETLLKCPLCREKFSTFEMLDEEYRNNSLFKTEKQPIHHGLTCTSCKSNPISGKCYKCVVCRELYLCQACFNTEFHKEHEFLFREKDSMKYRKASRDHVGALPQAIATSLLRREISEQDYDLLLQLDQQNKSNAEGFSKIPEKIIKSWPSERIRDNNKLLAPGYQCRVCLRNYEIGQLIRKLPACKHRFHAECIDNWLLHSHPTCPIDGIVAWSAELAEQTKAEKINKSKNDGTLKTEPFNLEIASIGLMINYKTSPVIVNASKNNLAIAGDPLVHRNSKPPKNRAVTTNQIKNGPVFEIKGQNVAANYVHKRHNSVSSNSGSNYLNDSSSCLNNQRILLPKINSKKSDIGIEDENELNERQGNSVKSAFDAFSISGIVGTKPYQMSRLQNNNELNTVSGLNSINNNLPSPQFFNAFNGISSNESDNFLNETHNESINSYISEEENRLKQLENYSSLLSRNQILLFQNGIENDINNNNNNNNKLQNSRKLGLRIHHPKTKLTSLNRKNEKKILLDNHSESLNSLQLVAVPAIKHEEILNYGDQCLNYYPTSESDENYEDT